MKKISLVILATFICLTLTVFGFEYKNALNKNELWKAETIKQEKVIQEHSRALGLMNIWCAADNYNNIDVWRIDYLDCKANIQDLYSQLESKQLAEEQNIQVETIKDNIKNCNSVLELKTYINQLNQVLATAEVTPQEIEVENNINHNDESVDSNQESQESQNYNQYSTLNFRSMGVIYWGDYRYTWYSQNVLPGGGLNIPGRHVGDNDLIYDGDGYIVVASNDLSYRSIVDTPFGLGKVYDSGCASGTIDIYTNF